MIKFQCSACGKNLNVKEELAGRTGKCPECGEALRVPDAKPPPPFETNMASGTARNTPVDKTARPPSAAPAARQSPRTVRSLGIASLILGSLALLICWLPMIDVLGTALGGFGLLLGTVGLVVSIIREGDGIGLAITGAAVCLVALVAPFAISPTRGTELTRVATEDEDTGGVDQAGERSVNRPAVGRPPREERHELEALKVQRDVMAVEPQASQDVEVIKRGLGLSRKKMERFFSDVFKVEFREDQLIDGRKRSINTPNEHGMVADLIGPDDDLEAINLMFPWHIDFATGKADVDENLKEATAVVTLQRLLNVPDDTFNELLRQAFRRADEMVREKGKLDQWDTEGWDATKRFGNVTIQVSIVFLTAEAAMLLYEATAD